MPCSVVLVAVIYNAMEVEIAFSSEKRKPNNKKFIHEIGTTQSGLF